MQNQLTTLCGVNDLLRFRLQKYEGRTLTVKYALYTRQFDLLESKLKQIIIQNDQISTQSASKKSFRQLITYFKNKTQILDLEYLLKQCLQSRKRMIEAFYVDQSIYRSLGYSPSRVDECGLDKAISEIECVILFCECLFQHITYS